MTPSELDNYEKQVRKNSSINDLPHNLLDLIALARIGAAARAAVKEQIVASELIHFAIDRPQQSDVCECGHSLKDHNPECRCCMCMVYEKKG